MKPSCIGRIESARNEYVVCEKKYEKGRNVPCDKFFKVHNSPE